MEVSDSSELQHLLEVSRGVRKLTQMIDSLSKAPNLDARSRYAAKDLQRGSLALQESLITIRRLQETSRMMSLMQETCFSVNQRQAALPFPRDNRAEIPLIQKQKRRNSPAETPLKHEVKRLVKRMDGGDSAQHSPKSNYSAFVTSKQQRKKIICRNDKASERRKSDKVTSASSLSQARRIEPPHAKPDKILAAAKGVAKIPSNAHRKKNSKKEEGKVSTLFKNIEQAAANAKCKGVAAKRTKPVGMNTDLCSSLSSFPIHHGFFRDDKRMGGKRFCEIMPVIRKGGKNRAVSVKPDMPKCSTEAAGLQMDVKMLLLSCPKFLTEAEQMFGYEAKTENFDEERRNNSQELILGFAKELAGRRKYQLELSNRPTSWGDRAHKQSSKALICLEHLVEDISVGVKELNNFCMAEESGGGDDVYYKLERDLRCTNLFLNAAWDLGWVGWFCVEEMDAVVDQLEERIISGLLREVALDLGFRV